MRWESSEWLIKRIASGMDADIINTNTAQKIYIMHDLSVLLLYLFSFLNKGNEYTWSTYIICSPAQTTNLDLTYSQSHYIISLKEAKMHFNKTRCSVTFDLFLRWPGAPDLSNANASDSAGRRAHPLPSAGGQRWIFIYTSTWEDSPFVSQCSGRFVQTVDLSFSQ